MASLLKRKNTTGEGQFQLEKSQGKNPIAQITPRGTNRPYFLNINLHYIDCHKLGNFRELNEFGVSGLKYKIPVSDCYLLNLELCNKAFRHSHPFAPSRGPFQQGSEYP